MVLQVLNLRATGIDYDIRTAEPYCSYEDFKFDVPVGTTGDTYDRFVVRNEEYGKVSASLSKR